MKIIDCLLKHDNNLLAEINNKNFMSLSDLTHTIVKPNNLKPFYVSVILPSYNVRSSLPHTLKSLSNQEGVILEIIIVDDGSPVPLKDCVRSNSHGMKIKYVRNNINSDRSISRNIGLQLAKNEMILVLDPDMVLPRHHIFNLALRLENSPDSLITGFKHNINLEEFDTNIEPDYRKDWRYFRQFSPNLIAPNFKREKEEKERALFILEESRNFSDFKNGLILGAWDISCLALGHTLFFNRKNALTCGGFVDEFRGWGHDDIAFTSKMITLGVKIIPCTAATGFHINHPSHSGSTEQKINEFKINLEKYHNLINSENKNEHFMERKIIKENLGEEVECYHVISQQER